MQENDCLLLIVLIIKPYSQFSNDGRPKHVNMSTIVPDHIGILWAVQCLHIPYGVRNYNKAWIQACRDFVLQLQRK